MGRVSSMVDMTPVLKEILKILIPPVDLIGAAFIVLMLGTLYLISTINYVLFHSIVEVAGIAVSFSIFIIVWNTQREDTDGFFLIVGISFLFFGSIDLVHTLAYKGMSVFPGNSSDLPTQLWIAARYFQSITFLVATFFIGRSITRDRKYDAGIIIAGCTAACVLLFASIFVWQNFPHCFIEGTGLTQFKIVSEYIISLILIFTIIVLYLKREHFDPTIWKLLISAQVFLILGELAFTSYVSVYGFMNLLGHLFRFISVFLFYRVFVVFSLTRPFDLILRDLKEKENALQKSVEQFRAVFDQTFHLMGVLDRQGILVEINTVALRYLMDEHIDPVLVLGKSFWLTPWWTHDSFQQEQLKRAIPRAASGEVVRFETFYPSGTGLVYIDFSLKPVKDKDGDVILLIAECWDITACKKAEVTTQKINEELESRVMVRTADLKATNEKLLKEIKFRKSVEEKLKEQYSTLSGIINSSNALIFSVDHQYRYTSFNQGHAIVMKVIYGAEIEIGFNILNYMTVSEDRENARHNLDRALAGEQLVEEVYSGEEHRSRKCFQVSYNPIWNDGTIIGVVVLAQDMTERKITEEALRESKEKFRILFEQATDAIAVYDADLVRFVDANANGEQLFGCDRMELIRYDPAQFFHPDPPYNLSSGERIQDNINRVINGEKIQVEQMIRSINGDIRICEIRMVRLPSSDRKLIRFSFIDITERKRTEKELTQYRSHLEELIQERTIALQNAKEQAEKANLAKSTFLSSMSHELRTPLNAILGFTQILIHQENLDVTQREQLNIVRNSGEHLLNLINDLLDLGRIEAEKMEIQHSAFNLPDVIQEIISISTLKAEEKDLIIHFEPQTLLPEHVLGDERKIKQIFLNLLSNAVKYTQEGNIIIRVWYEDTGSGLLSCEIEDTGIGIPKNKLDVIFEPFSNLSSERRGVEGAGLGLSITKKLVEMMQGTLKVRSDPGKGSVFRFEVLLPSVELSEAPLKTEDLITGYEGERKSILVVDDNPENAELLVSLLKPIGFEVMIANSGKESVDIARKEKPDLILLDLVMPIIDGLDVLRILKKDPNLNHIHIIGVSAQISQNERKQ